MNKLVFATNNKHKLTEVSAILNGKYEILSLSEIGCYDDIPETADTLEGNAYLKAIWVKEKYGYDCFADDTGLEVEALEGAPGVYSARYAGENATYADNNRKLMSALANETNRKAKFRTVICLIINNKTYYFEGNIAGSIAKNETGFEGFGYDPIFIPDGYEESYALMGSELKNKISHRAKATEKLIEFLSNID